MEKAVKAAGFVMPVPECLRLAGDLETLCKWVFWPAGGDRVLL